MPFLVFLLCAVAELASLAGFFSTDVRIGAMIGLGLAAVALACLDLRWLYAALLVEMLIGSHGRLFFAETGGFSLSIRMLLFAVLVIGWTVHAMRGCARIMHFRHAHVAGPLLLLIAAVTLGTVRGWALGASFMDVFNDANGYAFILLIPIGLDLFADRAAFAWLMRVLSGAVAWLAAKSLILLYLFTHDFGPFLDDLFRWQRRYGLSEITHLAGGAVRVFAASELFLIPAVFLGVLMAWHHRDKKMLFWTALTAAALLLSMSRSFWLGMVMAAGCMLPVFVRVEIVPWNRLSRLIGVGLAALGMAAALIVALTIFPLPGRLQDASVWSAYGGRFTDASDAAVSSRWQMLEPLRAGIAASPVLGSGFGAVITYRSDDPRIIGLHPGGILTTGAIEWQYLEIWLKMGLLGVIAIVWLWWRIGFFFWKTIETARDADRLVAAGLMLSFLAFVAADIFTPYINHPLGWAFLAFVIIGFHAAQEHELPEHHETPRPIPLR